VVISVNELGGQSEVNKLHVAVIKHDVLGLKIVVASSGCVQAVQGVNKLMSDLIVKFGVQSFMLLIYKTFQSLIVLRHYVVPEAFLLLRIVFFKVFQK
jgi:hypothetical protein